MKDRVIVMLAGKGESTSIIYHSLKDDFQVERVILEEPVPRLHYLRRRVERLGFFKVLGQIFFRSAVVPYLKVISRRRINEIKESFNLNDAPIDESKITNVKSVNSDETLSILREIGPQIVIVNGTRVISSKILDGVAAKFINMHAGITPLYRGVHGAYWALVENNRSACGVTVFFVDRGIDTGTVLGQEIIRPTKDDNFVTYPLLQLAAGIPLLKKAIREVFDNRVELKPHPEGRSRLWSHPTLLEYVWHRVRRGVS